MLNNAQQCVQWKREKYRSQIRKLMNEEQFMKKRIQSQTDNLKVIDEVITSLKDHINDLIRDPNENYSKEMDQLFTFLIEEDIMNTLLMYFQGNNVILRKNIYWILNNLTLGENVVSKLIFDLNFNILNIIFRDTQDTQFCRAAIDILENFLADKDIDVFEDMMEKGLLNLFHYNLPIEKLLIQVCCCIVQYKYEETNQIVTIINQQLPKYFAFQCVYILAKGMPIQNEYLIQQVCQYLKIDDLKIIIIILKILEQVDDVDIWFKLIEQGLLINLQSLLQNSNNLQIRSLIYNVLYNIYSYIDIRQQYPIKCIDLIFNDVTHLNSNAIRCIIHFFIHYFLVLSNLGVYDQSIFVYLLQRLTLNETELSIAILELVGQILINSDETNDGTFETLFKENERFVEIVALSEDKELREISQKLLQCYGI